MRKNLLNIPLFALLAGAFLLESETVCASSPVVIDGGTYDSAIYGVNTKGCGIG